MAEIQRNFPKIDEFERLLLALQTMEHIFDRNGLCVHWMLIAFVLNGFLYKKAKFGGWHMHAFLQEKPVSGGVCWNGFSLNPFPAIKYLFI